MNDAAPATPRDSGEPHVSIEVERKYDVSETTALPVLLALPGAVTVDGPELRMLDAVYFDTTDTVLARARVALRRREGGPDAGWHIKGPMLPGGGRREYQWPFGAADETAVDAAAIRIPEHVAAAAAQWGDDAPLLPLARVQNAREVWNVRDAAGHVVIEFVDDHVTGCNLRGGTAHTWREWEAELGPAAPEDEPGREALFAALEREVRLVGGRASASTSKLARAMGASGTAEPTDAVAR